MYEVDLSPLEELKNENFDQQILECINPSGEVSECSSGFLQFVFNPIECRSYTVRYLFDLQQPYLNFEAG